MVDAPAAPESIAVYVDSGPAAAALVPDFDEDEKPHGGTG
jgi:hypothetical protein